MHTPKLCHHKASELGYVTLGGRERYCGQWPRGQKKAPPAVRAEYDRLISIWLAHGRTFPEPDQPAPPPRTVDTIILAFTDYAEKHYRGCETRAGGKSTETEGIKAMCSVLTDLFGRLPVDQFGPKALKAVRAKMVELDWSRNYVNKQVNRLKRMFRWATAEELVSPRSSTGYPPSPRSERANRV
jgi:hypothetical protein